MTNILRTHNLSFQRNESILFENINFTLEDGMILQIHGSNGAGKTTLLRILAGLLKPTSGNIFWNNQALAQERDIYNTHLLYLGHQPAIKMALTVLENLKFSSYLNENFNLSKIDQSLSTLNLMHLSNVLAANLSAGQKRRLALCQLMLANKMLWILDEPMASLDQKGIAIVQVLMKKHLQNKGMIMITSHQPLHFEKEMHIQKLCLTQEEFANA